MKSILITGAILGALILLGCGKSSSSGGGGNQQPPPNTTKTNSGYASTPQPCNTQNQNQLPVHTNVNCQQYTNWYSGWNPNQMQWYYGPWYWPYQYHISGSNCGCPSGYHPVYGNTFGVACAPVAYLNSKVIYYNYGWSGVSYWNYPQNSSWLNIPQVPYQGSSLSTCGQVIAQGCDVRLNTCPSGSTCQPVGGGSTIGLCVK